jgi:CRP-like cAMP-binding protein
VQLDPSPFVADPELIVALEARSMPIICDTDTVLFRQGDDAVGAFILQKGDARLTMNSPEGESILSTETAAGSLLGLPGLIGNQPYSLTATALAGARVSFIARDDFTEMMQGDPRLALKILLVLAAEVRSARNAIR